MTSPNRHGIGRERVMLMGDDRVFYLGLLGAPSVRNFGSLTVYAALDRPFRICLDGRRWVSRELAVVPPYRRHSIETDDQMIGAIMLEPDSVDFGRLPDALSPGGQPWGDAGVLARIHRAYAYLQTIGVGATVEGLDGDQLFWGGPLVRPDLDPRIAAVVDTIRRNPTGHYTAEQSAEEAGLSFSRFLHLFKEEVGVTFRKFRAWKRARTLLYYVNRRTTLLDVALEVGYPDSTHFSHSIRQYYGLRPKEIFAGSRRLSILVQEAQRVRAA